MEQEKQPVSHRDRKMNCVLDNLIIRTLFFPMNTIKSQSLFIEV